MSEKMRPLSFAELMDRALGEYAQSQSIFGVREEKFYRNVTGTRVCLFGCEADSPVGPAAGPGSQLADNIVAAYLAGARVIEVKTVQIMDGEELAACVARPCINATDECYNVEWSTELTVTQALEEYAKAWILCHVLGREFKLGCNVVFNMSVGYSLDGVKSPKIDAFLEGMRNAGDSAIWAEATEWLKANSNRFQNFTANEIEEIPTQVSDSVTVSTLHGCPADEIERIATYLLSEKGFHTYVKCNPTLLGYESARSILDAMGYDYIAFDDHHFLEDLQFDDAVAMFKRLMDAGEQRALSVGAKITNTFPVEIKRNELPGEEMYMSGRSLFALSLTVAARLSEALDGNLRISYSGGIDAFNIAEVIDTGIRPVTVATSLLKPGGYERLNQLATIAEDEITVKQRVIDVDKLNAMAKAAIEAPRYRKEYREGGSRKSDTALPLFDCAQAPCSETGCPINQQIPAYLEQVRAGDYASAFEIIVNDNVLPSVTGTICNHNCQTKCTRVDYDDSLQIRTAKKAAVVRAQGSYISTISPTQPVSDAEVLVIGAGPAGIAAASYLARNGVAVTVRERLSRPLGVVSHVIPDFRISDAEGALDVALAEAYGVNFEFDAEEEYDLSALRKQYPYVILATGAWKESKSALMPDGDCILDALDFLVRSRESKLTLDLGQKVAVIGGGDVAMDCARAAARNSGVKEVTIVYRRTKDLMPAQREEIELALEDGVKIVELRSPQICKGNQLICDIMELGAMDESGRASVSTTGTCEEIPFDTIIVATGAGVDTTQFVDNNIALGSRGYAELSPACESSVSGVYIIGDCKAGPKTVVAAMADAKAAAIDILSILKVKPDFVNFETGDSREQLLERKGVQVAATAGIEGAASDAARCLGCSSVCEVCVDVCPNRANVAIRVEGFEQACQILHLDPLCNECGNCAVFCPSAGNPYLDKWTLFASLEDFNDSENQGFLPLDDGSFKLRFDGKIIQTGANDAELSSEIQNMITTITSEYGYLLSQK